VAEAPTTELAARPRALNSEVREPVEATPSPVSVYPPRAYDVRSGYMSGRGLY